MPKVGSNSAPLWTPIGFLRPGTEFSMPPGGATAGGVFLGLVGSDAKVAAREHSGRERREWWSGAALVLPGRILLAEEIERLQPAATPPTQAAARRRDERRTNVLTQKEQKAIVQKLNARLAAAPPPQARRSPPAVAGDEL